MSGVLNDPLLPKPVATRTTGKHTKASMFYGAGEYLNDLKKKAEKDQELSELLMSMPDGGHSHAAAAKTKMTGDKMLTVQKDKDNRSHKTKRKLREPNKPDPMPPNLAFLFTKITEEQMYYMWNVLTFIFFTQCALVFMYLFLMRTFVSPYEALMAEQPFDPASKEMYNFNWWACTLAFGIPFWYMCIQNIYICHDVMHGATFPPYEWQRYITHCWSDFHSLPWEEFILEHNRHHASTQDLLLQGEFGWDPEEFQYWLLEWTWNRPDPACPERFPAVKKALPFPIHPCGLIITALLMPVIHFCGLNDTGALFAIEWYFHFPDAGAGGKCNKEFYRKWFPRRMSHSCFVLGLWTCVWFLGTWPLGREITEGWRFMLAVSFFARCGFGSAWMFITNFTHSHPWNRFLNSDPERSMPIIHNTMAFILGGKARWNEMLFHDVHHAFPNAVGTMSQRGRFHGWSKVHDAALEVLGRGIWKPNGDEDSEMQKHQRSRSILMQSTRGKKPKALIGV